LNKPYPEESGVDTEELLDTTDRELYGDTEDEYDYMNGYGLART
jgi:hypothetical protein